MAGQQAGPDGSLAGGSPVRPQPPTPPQEALRRRAIRLEYFTVGWNVLEAAVALGAGWLAASIALEGFGLDSLIETASGLVLLWRLKRAAASDEQAESRAVKLVGWTFVALAAYVVYAAGSDLWLRRAPSFSWPGLILAAASLLVMPALGLAKRRVAHRMQSRALAADSLETLMCAYLSASLLVGLGLNGWKGWWWTDPVAALAMAAYMLREGVEALRGEAV
jgi:divalent metal cation (Fe/Co/Zn/Cd) transporter